MSNTHDSMIAPRNPAQPGHTLADADVLSELGEGAPLRALYALGFEAVTLGLALERAATVDGITRPLGRLLASWLEHAPRADPADGELLGLVLQFLRSAQLSPAAAQTFSDGLWADRFEASGAGMTPTAEAALGALDLLARPDRLSGHRLDTEAGIIQAAVANVEPAQRAAVLAEMLRDLHRVSHAVCGLERTLSEAGCA